MCETLAGIGVLLLLSALVWGEFWVMYGDWWRRRK